MDVRTLRYFVAIVESGSLTKAADRVCVAQPALSHHLAGLEADLGVSLLVRNARGVTPTEAGNALYRNALSILKQFEQARADILNAGNGVSGTVAIGLPTTAAAVLAMPLLRQVRERYPQIKLQLFESMSGYISELLANARLDFAVLFRVSVSRAVEDEPLADEKLMLVGQPGLAAVLGNRTGPVSLAQLGDAPLVLPSGGQGLRLLVERSFSEAHLEPNVIAELDSLPCLIAAAEEGMALTILPSTTLQATGHDIPNWDLDPPIRRTLSLCWPKGVPRTPAATVVEKILREIVAKYFGTEISGASYNED